MANISIYIARHLCTAPRPQKEATALAAAGHDVAVHGIAYDPVMALRDQAIARDQSWRWEPIKDFTRFGGRLGWLRARIRHRLAKYLFHTTGRISADVWSNGNSQMRRHALSHPVDLTIVHAEGGLWFGQELMAMGRKVGVDFEDWFSEDLAPEQRGGRPVEILQNLERHYCQNTAYCFTTSHSLANAMGQRYETEPPKVIYNSFPRELALPDPKPVEGPLKLHWFSLKVGPERGLELLMDALNQVPHPWTLELRGEVSPAYATKLTARLDAPLRERLSFSALVPAAELATALTHFDVGLALESSKIPSRNLTVTNKLFHYLQAGLPVVASGTAGTQEILNLNSQLGRIFPPGNLDALVKTLTTMTKYPEKVHAAKIAARECYNLHLSHESQAQLYGEWADRILAEPSP